MGEVAGKTDAVPRNKMCTAVQCKSKVARTEAAGRESRDSMKENSRKDMRDRRDKGAGEIQGAAGWNEQCIRGMARDGGCERR